jgi:Na+/proline symporter
MSLTTLALIVLAPVLVWRIYSRLKAQMARQRSIMTRHYTGVLVFAAMVMVPASDAVARPLSLGALLAGTALGIALGLYGLRKTRFEDTPEGYFFTHKERLGMAVAMVLVARVLYIGLDVYINQGSGVPAPRFTDSPLTMWCVGLVGAYFCTYSVGVLRWRWRLEKAVRRAE